MLLLGCGSGYQAPVTEQGEPRVLESPVIVISDSNGDTSVRGAISSVSRNSSVNRAGTPAAQGNTHRVRRGDTLYSVAFQYDLDFRSLAIANNLTPPYTIMVDQELNLDLSNPLAPAGSGPVVQGTAVLNNGVANARAAGASTGTVIRQSLGSVFNSEPQWHWPIEGGVLAEPQSDGSSGKGIDIGGASGQPVLAAADGEVVYAGNGIQGSGNLVIIRHSDRFLSAYAQNRNLLVTEGMQVIGGDTIAELGQGQDGLGRLHFEIRLDGKPVDPLTYLPGR